MIYKVHVHLQLSPCLRRANVQLIHKGQNIPYFRFSPSLDEKIESGETDSLKLISMIIQTKISIAKDQDMTKLVSLLCSTNMRRRTSPFPLR